MYYYGYKRYDSKEKKGEETKRNRNLENSIGTNEWNNINITNRFRTKSCKIRNNFHFHESYESAKKLLIQKHNGLECMELWVLKKKACDFVSIWEERKSRKRY